MFFNFYMYVLILIRVRVGFEVLLNFMVYFILFFNRVFFFLVIFVVIWKKLSYIICNYIYNKYYLMKKRRFNV